MEKTIREKLYEKLFSDIAKYTGATSTNDIAVAIYIKEFFEFIKELEEE
jgi:hypothetical protein